MAADPHPPRLEDLGDHAFSFYPPIWGVEHNEWKFVRATWSEMLVHNTKSGSEIWVPRRFLGGGYERQRYEEGDEKATERAQRLEPVIIRLPGLGRSTPAPSPMRSRRSRTCSASGG